MNLTQLSPLSKRKLIHSLAH